MGCRVYAVRVEGVKCAGTGTRIIRVIVAGAGMAMRRHSTTEKRKEGEDRGTKIARSGAVPIYTSKAKERETFEKERKREGESYREREEIHKLSQVGKQSLVGTNSGLEQEARAEG